MKFVNDNLISLKCVLFLFFGGMGCLMPYLPLHMLEIGLTLDEARIISIIAPCVALIGPLVVGPLADRMAGESGGGNSRNKNGRYLRLMIVACLLLACIFYCILTGIPSVVRLKARRPLVSFSCDQNGGVVFQERCTAEKTCHNWENTKTGSLFLTNCKHVCQTPPQALRNDTDDLVTIYPEENPEDDTDNDYDPQGSGVPNEAYIPDEDEERRKRDVDDLIMLEPPHLCYNDTKEGPMCRVYTENSKKIRVEAKLLKAVSSVNDSEEEWCRYPLDGHFSCRISQKIIDSLMRTSAINNTCHAVVQCNVDDPYDAPQSVLAESQCVQVIGQPDLTFWSYLIIRSIADIFPTAAIVLLDAAIIIATRETSSGRDDVGRQFAIGSLGLALFAPIVGASLQGWSSENSISYAGAFYFFTVLMLITAVVLIFANGMPLSPPEWWWHTRCGMLALPLSAVRKYEMEIGALVAVLLLLGVFWSTLDSYLPWHLLELSGSPFLIGLTLTIGTLPALPFLWFAEKILDYCGHANVLITAFTVYIIRYTVLSSVSDTTWIIIFEALEIFTLALMWITAVLYMRHLVPRRFTVTGQALPVIAHFCLGRCIGAIIGGVVPNGSDTLAFQALYRCMAISAAVVAIIYFVLYHCYLKPRCAAPTTGPPQPPPTVLQGMNGNGSYTPLRVYHNGRDKKGQFRY